MKTESQFLSSALKLQRNRYGIRIDDPDYSNEWLNGFGHCPFKEGDQVQLTVRFNDPYYNIIKIEGELGELKDASEIPEETIKRAVLSETNFEMWQKTAQEGHRTTLMGKAVDLAIKWGYNHTGPIMTLYEELCKGADIPSKFNQEVKQ